MKKRVSITIEKEPFELLQKNAKKAGFGAKWFSHEIDKLVQGLSQIVSVAAEMAERGETMTDKERKELIVKKAEEVFGIKIKDLKK